jgi:hypothetical protein
MTPKLYITYFGHLLRWIERHDGWAYVESPGRSVQLSFKTYDVDMGGLGTARYPVKTVYPLLAWLKKDGA